MIRKFFLAIEEWMCNEESMILSVGKFFLVIIIILGIIAAPFFLIFGRGKSKESICLESGNGWAISGQHTEHSFIWSGKIMIPTSREIYDYGCFPIQRN